LGAVLGATVVAVAVAVLAVVVVVAGGGRPLKAFAVAAVEARVG
jgi:hypothetical protein